MKIIKPLIIDTNVFIDMFLNENEFHDIGEKIGLYLIDNNIIPLFPFHLLFEIAMVTKQILQKTKAELKEKLFTTALGGKKLQLQMIDIDSNFYNKYFNPTYPYIKGMDYIIMALAKGENAVLVTRDDGLISKSKEIDIEVYKSEEFYQKYITMDNC